jgi:hypothetical protein
VASEGAAWAAPGTAAPGSADEVRRVTKQEGTPWD